MKTHLATAALLLLLTACGGNSEANKSESAEVACKTITVYSEELENKWTYVGEIKASSSIGVSFSVPGLVQKVHVQEGDKVRKGQLLAEIDPRDIENNYRIAKAAHERALDAQRRVRMMHDEQSVADIKYVEVETKVEQADAAFAAAQKRMDDTKLYSPITGVVGKRNIDPGENMALGISAFTILDISTVSVKIPIPEREISNLQLGDRALVRVLALEGNVTYNARVSHIGVMSDPLTHSYNVSLDIDNANGVLREGMVCHIQLWPESKRGERGFRIPITAVNLNSQSQHYLWLVRDGKATRQIVTLGAYTAEGVKVISGLRDGDKVITEGLERLAEGATVKEIKSTDMNVNQYF